MKVDDCKKQEGFVLVVVAVTLVLMVSFVALGVDVGVLYSARTSAQEVADAAALAGAFTFISQPTSPQPETATTHATEIALNNSIMGRAVTAGDVSVSVDVANRRVEVNVASIQNTYFARVIGPASVDIAVEAIAEAANQATSAGPCKVKPWFIPNTVVSASEACPACAANEVLVSGGAVTAFALSKLGQQFTVKPQIPTGAIGPGQFYAINMPGSTGGSDYRDDIGEPCTDPPVIMECQDWYSVKTGNMVGPTKQGVRDLIGYPPNDSFAAAGNYLLANGARSDMSEALVMAPIWDTCGISGFCPSGKFGTGTNVNLQIIGFALFFLEGIQGDDVVGRLINVSACGLPGNPSPNLGGSVLSIPLRLVRLP